ncbi:Pyridine nucleotide-disulfide oxidoreductase domain-containing protein 1 [Schistosoma japonicum]|nr:Pyridine nucleotide-disulfide oxidoreductase domain-containing protein 1 [Schistosoma japonicum]KAH8877886.1 Pyridine nucleotide-disulfide oxidoreductase domain-containing protein 1 [Schistosoma japonicum]KAH8877888.1 Pyridine nucleotide-disulfide oxidoreductase domain-containing protein 1 [Schistosoma japonicum]KAH8877889.1 Pyridine nucleotide-disulfide oxidoreductase domain-containing protein 1 [Schistosoma japonicum]
MSTVSNASDLNHFDFVIVGGGIAGVVCAETLCELLNPSRFSGALQVSSDLSDYVSKRVALISASKTVKTTINLRRISNMIETFDVEEKSSSSWSETWPNTLTVICDTMIKLDPSNHTVYLQQYGYENPIFYDKLCLTTGGVPRLIDLNHPYVIALRDTESIKTFQHRLLGTRRMLLVGNGGIATEIAYEVSGCQIIWVIKDSNISTPFLDAAAARFLLEASEISKQNDFAGKKTQCSPKSCDHEISEDTQIRRMRYVVAENDESEQQSHGSGISKSSVTGAALGPDWAYGRNLHGRIVNTVDGSLLKVIYQTKVSRFLSPQEFHDLNKPETLPFTIKNNDNYNVSSVDDWPVYVELTNDEIYGCDLVAAKSMFYRSRGDNYIPLDFSFELFTHVTYFFGFKVVLLGRFNGQGMNLSAPDTYLLMRITRGREFIKCIMRSGRMQGAVLIGETDLEETLENLILNQIDLTNLEDHLLDPDIDLSDYFD